MKLRLTIIDAPARVDCNNDILIEESEVSRWRVNIASSKAVYLPRARTEEIFTPYRRERIDQLFILCSGFPG